MRRARPEARPPQPSSALRLPSQRYGEGGKGEAENDHAPAPQEEPSSGKARGSESRDEQHNHSDQVGRAQRHPRIAYCQERNHYGEGRKEHQQEHPQGSRPVIPLRPNRRGRFRQFLQPPVYLFQVRRLQNGSHRSRRRAVRSSIAPRPDSPSVRIRVPDRGALPVR